MTRDHIGVLAAVASSAIGGIAGGATRFVIHATDPVTLGVFRFGTGFLILLPIFTAGGAPAGIELADFVGTAFREKVRFLGAGAIGVAAVWTLLKVIGPIARGIASALKREQIVRAREVGVEQIFTTNDETNTGMRGVNARLGYRPAPTRILVSGPLAT